MTKKEYQNRKQKLIDKEFIRLGLVNPGNLIPDDVITWCNKNNNYNLDSITNFEGFPSSDAEICIFCIDFNKSREDKCLKCPITKIICSPCFDGKYSDVIDLIGHLCDVNGVLDLYAEALKEQSCQK